jgi:putative ABC transport system ATP-binding protein
MTMGNGQFVLTDLHYRVDLSEGPLEILNGVNLELRLGGTLAITGASGSGKSTLLHVMAGLLSPSSGELFFNQAALHRMSENDRAAWRLQNVAFIFQSFELLDNLTALENIQFPLELKKEEDVVEKAKHYLELVGLSNRATHFPRTLSGGEKQRVAIARAFSVKPKLLFADEPTGNLDNKTGEKIVDLMFQLNDEHSTLVIVTHSKALAERAEYRCQLENGQLLSVSHV